MPTRLHFEKGHTLTVDEDVNAVESAFRTAAPGAAALVKLTKNNDKVFVNVALVRFFQEYAEPGPPSSMPMSSVRRAG